VVEKYLLELCFASATPRHRTVRDPEGVHRAVIPRRWPRWWDLPGDGREHSQVCHERTDILFVPVRRVVPDHALPMERATVSTDAASNGSGDLFVGPRADPCSHIAGNVATPQCAKGTPTNLLPASSVRIVTKGARCNREHVAPRSTSAFCSGVLKPVGSGSGIPAVTPLTICSGGMKLSVGRA